MRDDLVLYLLSLHSQRVSGTKSKMQTVLVIAKHFLSSVVTTTFSLAAKTFAKN